jgi:hypothetical protein
MNTKLKTFGAAALVGASMLAANAANATLATSYQFVGNGNWSIDGVGSNNTPVGTISAIVPLGSTVEKAFLYSSTFFNTAAPTVDFDGTVYSGASWTSLGTFTAANLTAFRTDVTTQVAAKIGGGSASPFGFSVNSEIPNSSIDGEVLAIVYSNPNELQRTIAFLDGGTDPNGDSFSFLFASPLTSAQLSDPAFDAQMSLGIGFSFRPSDQFSQVDVNGSRLTSDAGGQDDGVGVNGGLITVGGIGDDPANPADPFATNPNDPLADDELYTLTSFLSPGDTSIFIQTLNPSNDDNIFFAGFNITAVGSVVPGPPDPNPIPLPAPLAMLASGVLGLGLLARRRVRK